MLIERKRRLPSGGEALSHMTTENARMIKFATIRIVTPGEVRS